ncbi:glycosyl hydrolase family 18 protein [Cohnella sp. 56]|uniref:glycosyl hydrolase family 18 protein n=1 Tax=Cohnella sp. 56 TaxID=3113722 RepID=UPI0030E79F0A
MTLHRKRSNRWLLALLAFALLISPFLGLRTAAAEGEGGSGGQAAPAPRAETPQNIRVVSVTHNSVTLDWDDPTSGNNDVWFFLVPDDYKDFGNGSKKTFAGGFKPETTYQAVLSWDGQRAKKSDVFTFTTAKDTSQYKDIPLAPPSYLKIANVTADTATLSWGASPDADNYDFFVNGGWKATSPQTSYTVTGLTKGTTYKFMARAQNSKKTPLESSKDSNVVEVKWGELAKPQALQTVTATRTAAALGWASVAGATYYDVYQDGSLVGTSADNRYAALNLTEGRSYQYKVVARNELWTSPESDALTVVPGAEYTNVTYYMSWASSNTARNYQVADMDVSQITHINYAFSDVCWKKYGSNAKPCEDASVSEQNRYVYDGEILMGDPEADPNNFAELRKLRDAHPSLKLLISVGGWSWSNNWSNVAATEEGRRSFANSTVKFIRDHQLDGVDIDWEYPVEGGEDDTVHSPNDPQYFPLLMKSIREAFDAAGQQDGKYYLLTIASGQGDNFVRNADLGTSSKYFDFVNMMAYDYSGSWETLAHHNAPLYYDPAHPRAATSAPRNNVRGGLQGHLNGGVPTYKLVTGVPYYGKAWSDCPANGQYQTCGGIMDGSWESGILDYTDIEDKFIGKNGYVRYWNDQAKVPYLYSPVTKGFVTYNDKTTMMYTSSLVKSLDIAGVMSWDISGDRHKTLTTQLVQDLPIDGKFDASQLKAPTGLTAASQGGGVVQLAWYPSAGANGYEVYVNDTMVASVAGTTYAVSSLKPNTSYSIHLLSLAKTKDGTVTEVSPASAKLTVSTSEDVVNPGPGSWPGTPTAPAVEGQLAANVALNGDKASITLQAAAAVKAIEASSGTGFKVQAGTGAKQAELDIPPEVAAALAKKGATASLSLLVGDREYRIPAALIATSDTIRVSVLTAPAADAAAINTALSGKKLLSEPTVFKLERIAADKTATVLKAFGKSPVRIAAALDAKSVGASITIAGVVYDSAVVGYRPVPTLTKVNADGSVAVEQIATTSGSYALAASGAPSFADAPALWAQDDVAQAAAKLILTTDGSGKLAGKQNVTRGEIVSMIVRGLGLIPGADASVFADVPAASKYAYDIAAAYDAGLVKGRTGTTFDPDGFVTRQELAVMLANALSYAGKTNASSSAALGGFKDRQSVAAYARDAVAWLVDEQIIRGMSKTTIAPQATVTREQIVVTVMRALRALGYAN